MKIAGKILSNQDRDGMLRRSLERIIQLYTDKSHFVYELLQNAEDAGAHSIRFVQFPDRLEVMHDGHPFTTENLQSLCDIGKSDKVNDLNQIGEFGVGFKSVFGICDTVQLYSQPSEDYLSDTCQPFAVEIRDFTKPVDIDPISFPNTYSTLFVFPYSVGFSFSGFKDINALIATLSKRLKNLGITTLLFMHSLELIEYEIKIPGREDSGQYLLDKRPINDHCTRVSAIEQEGKKTDSTLSFIKFSMPVTSGAYRRSVDIAFALVTDKNGKTAFQKAKNPYISVYFPTETESKLSFIVQGPFRTTPNRSSVPADDEENILLADKVAELFRKSILELRDMRLLDLSLIRILPLDEEDFEVYPLFAPIYDVMWSLFSEEIVLPTKDNGGYVNAGHALIARSKELAELFPNDLISELYDDGKHYKWLPISLTETGPFKDVYYFFSYQLGIEVVRPEDLRAHFNENRSFIQHRDDKWLVQLYHMYEAIPNIFSERNSRNILDAIIVKTAANHFVAPYRKVESSYIPNVFLPFRSTHTADIEVVHPHVYLDCKPFFEQVLRLQAPNEYEFFTKALVKKYNASDFSVSLEEHLQDVQTILTYLNDPSHASDMKSVIRNSFMLRCRQGNRAVWAQPFKQRILFPHSESGIMLDMYYKGISSDVCFVDFDTYQSAGFDYAHLRQFGVTDQIVTGVDTTWGEYKSGKPGRQPEWRVQGDFRWKLSIDHIEDVLLFISQNPKSKDAMVKSQVIFKTLQENENRLIGTVWIGGLLDKFDEPADIVRILNNQGYSYKLFGWNGKWLFTDSQQLVSHKEISKHDLNKALYGKVSLDSDLYDILGFKKSKVDRYEAMVKDYDTLPEEKKQSYFAIELSRRYGITPEQLSKAYSTSRQTRDGESSSQEEYEFPTDMVKNWDALKKHAAQILSYASPVKYQRVVRSIRVSRPQDDVRAYLMNMYRVNASYKYACQLCHQPYSYVEMCQLEQKPDVELDPMNLCLCPTCAQRFRALRNDPNLANRLLESILSLSEGDLSGEEHVSVAIKDYDFWFTQTHIAEIIALLNLKQQADEAKRTTHTPMGVVSPSATGKEKPVPAAVIPVDDDVAIPEEPEEDAQEAAHSDADLIYTEFIGKRVYHRTKHAYAKVVACDGGFITLNFESGDRAGQDVKYNLTMCLDNNWLDIVD